MRSKSQLDEKDDLSLRIIIVYKLVKAPIMLALAVWLSVSPRAAYRSLETLTQELSEGSAAWVSVGLWIQAHVSARALIGGAMLAWLDGFSTALEGVLLLSGKSWGEWLVIVGLASLLCVEVFALIHQPSIVKALILGVNALIVLYLVRRRIRIARPENLS